MCDQSRTAPTKQLSKAELDALGREHPSNYSIEAVSKWTGRQPPRATPPVGPTAPPGPEGLRHWIELTPSLLKLRQTDATVCAYIELALRDGHTQAEMLLRMVLALADDKRRMGSELDKLLREGLPDIKLALDPQTARELVRELKLKSGVGG